MSKVEGGGAIDPPSRLRVTIFSRRLLGLKEVSDCIFLTVTCRSCSEYLQDLIQEALRGIDTPLDFFGFKFLLLGRLSKALAQLFLVYEHIF